MDTLQSLIDFFATYGYAAVFGVLMLCGFGLPVPEDITLVAGGIISGLGYTNVHWMFFISMVGVLLGDSILFLLGSSLGEKVLKFRPIGKLLTPARYALVQTQFEKYGKWVIFTGRFTPGLRAAIFLSAGLSKKISFWTFFAIDGFAALISVPIWVYLGYYGAHERERVLKWVHQGQVGIVSALALLTLAVLVMYWRRKRAAAAANLAAATASTLHVAAEESKSIQNEK